MRDRDPNRRERMARAQQQVISKDELEKRIDSINKEKEDKAHVRKHEDYDRQRERDRDEDRYSR